MDETGNVRCTRLGTGVLVLSEAMPWVESVALGVWADAGSADESPEEFGQAHFLEHMLFKGTETRSAFALAEAIENVGGQLNAFTEREATHLYARILAEHLPVAVDLLADMVCHSAFDPAELERERQVIVEEIRKYESLPEERINDLLMDGLWHGGGLGHPILGTEASVRGLTREDLVRCWRRHFAAPRVLITAAGRLEHEALVALLEDAFAEIPAGLDAWPAYPQGTRLPRCVEEDEDEEQVHFCWGGRTYPARDERNFALALVDAVMGASTTSRLFQEIREQRGLAYDVGSYTVGFRETGLLSASGACSPDTFAEVMSLVRRELVRLRRGGITGQELARAKEQIKAGIALAMESTAERMRRLAQHQFTWGQVLPTGYLIDRMNQVTQDDVMQVLEEILDLEQWTFAAIGPIDADELAVAMAGE